MKKMWKYLLFLPLLAFMVACDDDDDNTMNPEPELPSLVEAATDAGLTTLLDAVGAVDGLAEDLLEANEITVFAPTNEAFEAALEAYDAANLNELVEALGGVGNLETVLGYHVVADVAFAEDLSNGQSLPTLAGQNLTVNVTGSGVSVTDVSGNTFNVVTADVEIENGVVHVIDGVLLPELPEEEVPTIADALEDTADLSTLKSAVEAVEGLGTTLLGQEAITVFAPTNAAFGAVLEAYDVDNLTDLVTELGGVDKLEEVLGYHVVASTAFSTDLTNNQTLTTLNGQELTVTINNDGVFINGAQVTTADVEIANGVVHIIDAVLVPELDYPNVVEAATAAGLTTLIDAVTAAELGATLTGAEAITVFAPTNAAFAGLLERYDAADLNELITVLGAETVSNVLQFHVIPSSIFSHDLAEGEQTVTTLEGQELTVNKSAEGVVTVTDYLNFTYTVNTADVVIDNGVVHVIDGVLLPDVAPDTPNIVEAATEAGLTTLIDAVVAAELTNPLLQATAITVFAPSNEAFAALLAAQEVNDLNGLIEKLGAENVAKVLQFHVVPAVAFSTDLAEGNQTFTTLEGQELTVNRAGNTVTVTDFAGETYTVTIADVTIENGVVHVIDGVLLPEL